MGHSDDQQVHEKMLSITNHQGNASQNYNLTLIRMAITKKDKK